jgi:signal transduction histidine kinase
MDGVSVNLEELHLADTLKPIIAVHSAIAGEKYIRLKSTLTADAWIVADANMLQLVVRNLLNNAIKFTKSGGEITITSELHGNRWHIIVTDTGVGIDDERKSTIFSIKSQSTYGTRTEKGTGLGLLLCKEFTELQHGEIGFESTVGAGTTFYISMPASRLTENASSGSKYAQTTADTV